MTRWELITSNEYIAATVECVVRTGRPIKQVRKELEDLLIQYRDELLLGDQGKDILSLFTSDLPTPPAK